MKKNLTFKLVQKWKRKLNEENSCKNNFEKVVKASKEKKLDLQMGTTTVRKKT